MTAALKATPKPIIFLILSLLCPTEFSLFVADLRLPPHRVALLILLPIALFRLLSRKDIQLRPFDGLVLLFGAWTTYVYYLHSGDMSGFVYGGSLALESTGAYFVARAYIRTPAVCAAAMKSLFIAVCVSALIALPETLLGQIFVHDMMRNLTGYVHPIGVETRVYFTRAYGTFDHPIHYGTFCAGLFAMIWYSEARVGRRFRRAAIVGGATVLGLSSAPLLCLGMQATFVAWERVTRGLALRAAFTVAAIFGIYAGIAMVSNRGPINLIATSMTLDSWTGFYRLMIWTHGMENVWANPWFGIGLAEWDRPAWMASSTVDAFWLVIAMRSGIPSFLILAAAIVLLGRSVVVKGCRARDVTVRRLAIGWMMSLIALTLVGTTVHYWNVLHAYFFFFLGLAGWIADPAAWAKAKVKAVAGTARRSAARHSSFVPVRGRRPAGNIEPTLDPVPNISYA